MLSCVRMFKGVSNLQLMTKEDMLLWRNQCTISTVCYIRISKSETLVYIFMFYVYMIPMNANLHLYHICLYVAYDKSLQQLQGFLSGLVAEEKLEKLEFRDG